MSDFTVIHEDTPPQGNPLYAEIERLKRERDALVLALENLLETDEGWAQGQARHVLAQVRK